MKKGKNLMKHLIATLMASLFWMGTSNNVAAIELVAVAPQSVEAIAIDGDDYLLLEFQVPEGAIESAWLESDFSDIQGLNVDIFELFTTEQTGGVNVVVDFVTVWEVYPNSFAKTGGLVRFDLLELLSGGEGGGIRFAISCSNFDPEDLLIDANNSSLKLVID